jgi:hypothetical protein
MMNEGQNIRRLPLLEGPNYEEWKAKMRISLNALDEKTWQAVLIAWTYCHE